MLSGKNEYENCYSSFLHLFFSSFRHRLRLRCRVTETPSERNSYPLVHPTSLFTAPTMRSRRKAPQKNKNSDAQQQQQQQQQQQKEAVYPSEMLAPSPPHLEEEAPAAAAAAASPAVPSPSPSPPSPSFTAPSPPPAAAEVVVDAPNAEDGAAAAANDNGNNHPFRLLTSPGHRFLANFQDLFQSVTSRAVPSFHEFEAELNVRGRGIERVSHFFGISSSFSHRLSFSSPLSTTEPQAELSSLAELTGELRAARAKSDAKLRLEWRKLMDLKSVLEEISPLVDDDEDDDEADDGGEGEEGGFNGGDPFGDTDTVAGRSSGVFSDPTLIV